jgi:hypothetical protein
MEAAMSSDLIYLGIGAAVRALRTFDQQPLRGHSRTLA